MRDLSERYPEPKRDLFNIGLLHTALEGRPGHARYAPCRLSALIDRGYEYSRSGTCTIERCSVKSRDRVSWQPAGPARA